MFVLGLALLLASAVWLVSEKMDADPLTSHPSYQPPKQPIPAPQTKNQTIQEKPHEPTGAKTEFPQRKLWNPKGTRQQPAQKLSRQEVTDIEEAQVACADLMDALDENDTSAILAKARVLITHPNPEVRQRVLDALDWIGSDALYDLAGMLDDENSEIADTAAESFWEQVADLPNDQAKLKLLEGFSHSQDQETLSHLAENLSDYHPHVAHDLILSILSASPDTVNEDIQWELEGMTGEPFETASEWQEWFIKNKSRLGADYKDQDF